MQIGVTIRINFMHPCVLRIKCGFRKTKTDKRVGILQGRERVGILQGRHAGILQGRDLPASAQVGTYLCLLILGDSEDLAKLAIGITLHSTFLVWNAIRLRISVTLTLRPNRPQHRGIAAQHLLL